MMLSIASILVLDVRRCFLDVRHQPDHPGRPPRPHAGGPSAEDGHAYFYGDGDGDGTSLI